MTNPTKTSSAALIIQSPARRLTLLECAASLEWQARKTDARLARFFAPAKLTRLDALTARLTHLREVNAAFYEWANERSEAGQRDISRDISGSGSRSDARDISEDSDMPHSINITGALAMAVLLALVIVAGIWAGVTGGRF